MFRFASATVQRPQYVSVSKKRMPNITRRCFASTNQRDPRKKTKIPYEQKRTNFIYELDNRTVNREKAEAVASFFGHQEISKELRKCRTTKDYINYAKKTGADVTINSNHVKISKNGVTTGLHSPGKKIDLINSVRKHKVEAFKAMGIAWKN
jgi:hypothetical protein